MTANTNKSGCVCDICGATANNKKNKSRGMTLCSSCKGIVPCVDRLDVVVAMMQRTGKAEELLNKLRPHDDDNSDLEAVVRDARETLVKALPSSEEALEDAQSLYDIATIAEEAARYIQEQQEKITRLSDDAGVLQSIADIIGCRTHEVLPTLRTMALYALNHRDDNNSDKAEELFDKLMLQQDNSNRLEQELQGIAGIVGCTVNDIIPSLNELAAHLGCGHGEMLTALYSHDHDTNDNKSYQLELENNRLKRENEYLAQRKRQEPLDNALLEWARKQYEAGEIKLKVTVEAADENN